MSIPLTTDEKRTRRLVGLFALAIAISFAMGLTIGLLCGGN
jgi:hypothetical protein